MKRIFVLFLIIFTFSFSMCFADALYDEVLADLEAATSYGEAAEIIENNAGLIGLDMTKYNSLTTTSKMDIMNKICQSQFNSIDELKDMFYALVDEKLIQEDDSSPNSGSFGGGGGSASGGSSAIITYTDYAVKGTISLPDGFVAPKGGIELSLYINGYYEEEEFSLLSTGASSGGSHGGGGGMSASVVAVQQKPDFTITIPEGESRAVYEGNVSLRSTYTHAVAEALSLYNTDYFSRNISEKIELNSEEENILNLNLEKAEFFIDGKIDLGSKNAFTEALKLKTTLHSTDGSQSNTYILTIPAGEKTADFYLPAREGIEYELSYSFLPDGENQKNVSDEKFTYEEALTADIGKIIISPEYIVLFEGEIKLPDEIIPEENTYFYINITASNGEEYFDEKVQFSSEKNEKEFALKIPESKKDGEWIIFYVIDTASQMPTSPHRHVLNDSSFKKAVNSGSGGGGGYGGGYSYKIPEKALFGEMYYNDGNIVFDISDAKAFSFESESSFKIRFTPLTVNDKHERKIGGYFCSHTENIEFTVSLINIATLQTVDFYSMTFKNEAVPYSFCVTDKSDYIIKYEYDGKTFYYKENYILTEEIGEAKVFSVTSDPNSYGCDVYYNNEYYEDVNDRYFMYKIYGFNYDEENLKICIYDRNGNKVAEGNGYSDYISAGISSCYIGFEYAGQRRYFSSLIKNELLEFTDDIEEACVYIIAHVSYSGVRVVIDICDFISGEASATDGGFDVFEAYPNFFEDYNTGKKELHGICINMAEEYFENGNMIFVGHYDETGKMIEAAAFDYIDYSYPLEWILSKTDYIQVIGINTAIKPMFEKLTFFK